MAKQIATEWMTDQALLRALEKGAKRLVRDTSIPWVLAHVDDAAHDIFVKAMEDSQLQARSVSLAKKGQAHLVPYLRRAIVNRAKFLANRICRTCPQGSDAVEQSLFSPGQVTTVDIDASLSSLKDDDQRTVCWLLLIGYNQEQASEILAKSASTISRQVREVNEAFREFLEKGLAAEIIDNVIYDFIDDRPGAEPLGNFNLVRAIRRTLDPVRSALASLETGIRAPIPKTKRAEIIAMTDCHRDQPTLEKILSVLCGEYSSDQELCLAILYRVHRLYKPHTWVPPLESLLAVASVDDASRISLDISYGRV